MNISYELLWVMMMVVNFCFILSTYKLFGKHGLYGWIVLSSIVANIQVAVTVNLFGMSATLGNIMHGTSFLATDILSEHYGRKDANRGVFIGFFTMIATAVLMQIVIRFTPNEFDTMMLHVRPVFEFFPRVVISSLIAYLISQLHDTWAFEFWKKRTQGKYLWLRNNGSTIVSQIIDVSLFTILAFTGTMPVLQMVEIGISAYVLKVVVAICDTPFMYLSKKVSKNFLISE